MTTLKHTVNLAAAPIVTVFDDRGEIVDSVMVPICLLVTFPCWLYAAWLRLTPHISRLSRHAAAWLSAIAPGGWREDLHFMALALFSPPSGRGWGRAAL